MISTKPRVAKPSPVFPKEINDLAAMLFLLRVFSPNGIAITNAIVCQWNWSKTKTFSEHCGYWWNGSEAHGPLHSLRGKTSYCQILQSLAAVRLGVIMIIFTLKFGRHLASGPAECQWNFRAIGDVLPRILQLQDFTRSWGKTSVCLVNKGPLAV